MAKPVGRLRWLLNFSRLDAQAIESRPALPGEIRAFLWNSFRAEANDPDFEPAPSQIAEIVNQVRAGLKTFEAGLGWTASGNGLTLIASRGARGRPPFEEWRGPWTGCFLMAAARLAVQEGNRLRNCARPGCNVTFVKWRRARYCSEACLQAERQRKFKVNNSQAKRSELRRQYYATALEKKNPAAARVYRRRRAEAEGDSSR